MSFLSSLLRNTVLWMAATILPIQGMVVSTCDCGQSGSGMQERQDEPAARPEGECRCCQTRCVKPAAASRSCCHARVARSCCAAKRSAHNEPGHGACQCKAGCVCKGRNAVPRAPQTPPQPRVRPVDDSTATVAVVCIEVGTLCRSHVQESPTPAVAAPDFCVLFCRFLI
jgi:hypothetical protein